MENALDANHCPCNILIDLSKHLIVPHLLLIYKLKAYDLSKDTWKLKSIYILICSKLEYVYNVFLIPVIQ